MKKNILYIKGDNANNVRLAKCLTFFKGKDIKTLFWGWNRMPNKSKTSKDVKYLLTGGGYGSKKLILYYSIWMMKLFFKILLLKKIKNYNVIAVNFDAALPVYLASKIRRNKYYYEIHDEFSLSYNLSGFWLNVIRGIDRRIMRNAETVIHVDENRVTYNQCKSIVIENSPIDFFKGNEPDYSNRSKTFAVIGMLSRQRGIDEILNFAKDNIQYTFFVIGKRYNYTNPLLKLPNVVCKNFMLQNELFDLLRSCCGIFSLYDTSLKINKFAASNKVYDAMMLGIPVITNKEVMNSVFVEQNKIGIIIDYKYNSSWFKLLENDYIKNAIKMGKTGRKIYLKRFQFDKLLENKLVPVLE